MFYNKVISLQNQFLKSLLCAIILAFLPVFVIADVPSPELQNAGPGSLVELSFDYPDQVNAGESFVFTVVMKKDLKYNIPGMIVCSFTGGMIPGQSSLDGADFQIKNNTAIIRWDKLSKSNLFQFPLNVVTGKDQGGVYPVKVKYTDNNGLVLSENVGVYIFNKKEVSVPPVESPLPESPYHVRLVFPDEVSFNETYNLDIVIAKGKNTGGAKVFLQVPPSSDITVVDQSEYNYKAEQGSLCILMNAMPVSPNFSIRCRVKNTLAIKSVYPVRASVEFPDNTRISCEDYILVTNQPSYNAGRSHRKNSLRTVNAAVNADTASIFTEMDRLLESWRKASSQLQQTNHKEKNESKPESKVEDQASRLFEDDIVFYSVQIVASEVIMPKIENEVQSLGIDEKILEDYDGNIYRYSVGDFQSLEQARAMRSELMQKGYPDAFIVEYVNGVRSRSFY